MKRIKLLSLLLLVLVSLTLTSCSLLDSILGGSDDVEDTNNGTDNGNNGGNNNQTGNNGGSTGNNGGGSTLPPVVGDGEDYAGSIVLDMNSETVKAEVTVKSFIDGDTVHFNINDSTFDGGVLKARFLAVNTPESTGKIEEYGKQASDFTKTTLSAATSIIIESDDSKWNADSTGGRYLVWIWYKTSESESYRNLNIEILQNGLAIASNSEQNRYGSTCMAALNQAKALKLKVFSGEKDPLFFYGEAHEIDLKELRTNIKDYVGAKVAFEAVIFAEYSQTLYVEEYFPEDDVYYGMQVYYGFGASGTLMSQFAIGNRVRFVGTVSEWNGTYQVSGLELDVWDLGNQKNTIKISEGNPIGFKEMSGSDFVNKKIQIEKEDENGDAIMVDYRLAELSTNGSISMKNLQVTSVYTTTSEDSSSKGAMTLTCTVDGVTVTVRTEVLRDASGNLITAAAYEGKNINVKGYVEIFDGKYQIKVYSANNITINK